MSRIDDFYSLLDVRRDVWDPNDNTPAANRTVNRINRFEAHHTGGSGPLAMSYDAKRGWLRGIERFHEQTKGWSDIFYHLFIFADGEVWEGRRIDRTSQANIPTTVTVHYPGNNPVVTPEQAESALAIARWAVTDPDQISYHSERGSTACPGDNVRAHIHQLRKSFTVTNFPPIQIVPENLSTNADYLELVQKGFLSDADPDRVASRSVVGVVVNRAHNDALAAVAELNARVDRLEEAADEDGEIILTDGVVERIIQEIIKRLGA